MPEHNHPHVIGAGTKDCPACPKVMAEHTNSENERITIELCRSGAFAGQLILCLYDDTPGFVAPMLLDEGTQRWLVENLGRVPQFTVKS